MEQRIRTWFNNHGNDKGHISNAGKAVVLGKADTERLHQPHKIHSGLYYKERLKALVDKEVKRTGESRLAVGNRVAREQLAEESEEIRSHVFKVLDQEKKDREAADEAAAKILKGTEELKPESYAE